MKFAADVSLEAIRAAFPTASCVKAEKIINDAARKKARAAPPPPSSVMSKFALIRFDELDGVARHLSEVLGDSKTITADVLSKSLKRLRDDKARGLGEYCRFISDPDGYERFDASKEASWIVTEIEGIDLKSGELPAPVKKIGESVVVEAPIGDYRYVNVIGFASEPVQLDPGKPLLGAIRLRKLGASDQNMSLSRLLSADLYWGD